MQEALPCDGPAPAASSGAMLQAVFFDRDGTLVEERHYLRDPAAVRLRPGALAVLGRLQRAGVRLFVVTNQSGVGRGRMTLAEVEAVHAELRRQLAAGGVRLDGIYVCPHAPEAGCACRKPRPGLFLAAARAHGLELRRCWAVGDRWRDVLPVALRGGRGWLLAPPHTPTPPRVHAVPSLPALAEAAWFRVAPAPAAV